MHRHAPVLHPSLNSIAWLQFSLLSSFYKLQLEIKSMLTRQHNIAITRFDAVVRLTIAGDHWSPVKIRVNTKPAGLAGHKAHTTVPIHVDARASSLQCFQARSLFSDVSSLPLALSLVYWGLQENNVIAEP